MGSDVMEANIFSTFHGVTTFVNNAVWKLPATVGLGMLRRKNNEGER